MSEETQMNEDTVYLGFARDLDNSFILYVPKKHYRVDTAVHSLDTHTHWWMPIRDEQHALNWVKRHLPNIGTVKRFYKTADSFVVIELHSVKQRRKT